MDANFSYYNGAFCCTKLALFLVPFQDHTDAFCRRKNIFYHVSRKWRTGGFTGTSRGTPDRPARQSQPPNPETIHHPTTPVGGVQVPDVEPQN